MTINCSCVMLNRDWLKRCFCMHHWIQTNYYQDKLKERKKK